MNFLVGDSLDAFIMIPQHVTIIFIYGYDLSNYDLPSYDLNSFSLHH